MSTTHRHVIHMRSRIISTLALLTALMVLLGAHPASAAERVLSAPYASAGVINSRCDGCTTNTVTADAQTGRVDATSEIARAPLGTAGGVAATNGAITGSTSLSSKTKTVDATATLTLADVSTSLIGAVPDDLNEARVSVRITLTLGCSGCPGGAKSVQTEVILADVDPATAAPPSAAGTVSIALPRLELGSRHKATGAATVQLEAMTVAGLQAFCSCTLTTARAARARSDVTLTSVRLVSN